MLTGAVVLARNTFEPFVDVITLEEVGTFSQETTEPSLDREKDRAGEMSVSFHRNAGKRTM
jgi:hypothetical protein